MNDNILKKNRSLNTIKESKSIEENTVKIKNKNLNIPDSNNFLESNEIERTERIDLEKNYEEESNKNDSTSKYDEVELRRDIDFSKLDSDKKGNSKTPYKIYEINNEIYPNENEYFPTSENNNISISNINSIKSKLNESYLISQNEISFSIQSKYENIDSICNFKYSKYHDTRIKVNQYLKKTFCNHNIVSNDYNKIYSEEGFKKNSIIKLFTYKKNFSSKSNSNSNKSINNEYHSLLLKKSKLSNTIDKGNNILNILNKNIERNFMDLNNPHLFFTEFFSDYFKNLKSKKENPFSDLDEELIQKINIEVNTNNQFYPLTKFNEMLKKL